MASQLGAEQNTDWLNMLLDEQAAGTGLEGPWSTSTGLAAEVPVTDPGVANTDLPVTSWDDVPLPDVAGDDVDLGFLDSLLEGEDFSATLPTSVGLGAAASPSAATAPLAAHSPVLPQPLPQPQQPTLSGGSSAHSGYATPLLLQQHHAGSPLTAGTALPLQQQPYQQQPTEQQLLQHTPAAGARGASCSPAGSEAGHSGAVAGGSVVTPLPAVHATAVAGDSGATSSSSSGAMGSCPSSPPTIAGPGPGGPGAFASQSAVNSHGLASVGPSYAGAGCTLPVHLSQAAAMQGSAQGTAQGAAQGAAAPDDADEERKRQERMQRNRESAHLSRQRKKMQVDDLERRNTELGTQVKYLGGLVTQLGQENALLRHHLVAICQQTGAPLPPVATSPPPGVASLMPMAPMAPLVPGQVPPGMGVFPGMPGMPPGALPMPYGYAPKLPISKLPEPARPAPAARCPAQATATSVKVEAGSAVAANAATSAAAAALAQGGASSAGPARKRARATGGALLALFALFMVAGPAPSALVLPFGGANTNVPAVVEPYAAAAAAAREIPPHTGRVLASVGMANSSGLPQPSGNAALPVPNPTSLATSPPSANASLDPAANVSLVPAGSDAALERALALLPAPDAEAESVALQRLVDAGEAALVWDPTWAAAAAASGLDFGGGGGSALLPLWGDFPSLLGSAFRADGLLAPIGCEKVFEIDASHVPGQAKLKRRMDSWLSSAQGFRGRAVPLPPASTEPASDPDALGSAGPHPSPADPQGMGPRIGAAAPGGGGDVLVSIVLPTRHNAGGTGTPTPGGPGSEAGLGPELGGGSVLASLERIFVVVLQQSAVYATYSCQLPRLGVASSA